MELVEHQAGVGEPAHQWISLQRPNTSADLNCVLSAGNFLSRFPIVRNVGPTIATLQ
jgi:hypothetical protein